MKVFIKVEFKNQIRLLFSVNARSINNANSKVEKWLSKLLGNLDQVESIYSFSNKIEDLDKLYLKTYKTITINNKNEAKSNGDLYVTNFTAYGNYINIREIRTLSNLKAEEL